MDDFFQIMVLLITIVIFVVSALRKQKKQTNQNPAIIDGVLESFFGIPPELKRPIIEDEPEVQQPVEVIAKKPYKPDNVVEGEKAIINKPVENELVNESQGIEFNLRDAVIYSEILNRRTF